MFAKSIGQYLILTVCLLLIYLKGQVYEQNRNRCTIKNELESRFCLLFRKGSSDIGYSFTSQPCSYPFYARCPLTVSTKASLRLNFFLCRVSGRMLTVYTVFRSCHQNTLLMHSVFSMMYCAIQQHILICS